MKFFLLDFLYRMSCKNRNEVTLVTVADLENFGGGDDKI